MKYTLEIEAVQYKGGDKPFSEYPEWLAGLFATRRIEWNTQDENFSLKPYPDYDLYDLNEEDYIEIAVTDWIIRYPSGEVGVMEDSEFKAAGYEKAAEPKPVAMTLQDWIKENQPQPKVSPFPTDPDLNRYPFPKVEPMSPVPRTPEIWCHCSMSTPPIPDPSPENVRVDRGGFPN